MPLVPVDSGRKTAPRAGGQDVNLLPIPSRRSRSGPLLGVRPATAIDCYRRHRAHRAAQRRAKASAEIVNRVWQRVGS